jgi:hypothetical protein
VLTILVEATCHDTVCCVERLLDTVTVVDVDVDIQHTRVVTKELQDAEDNVWAS